MGISWINDNFYFCFYFSYIKSGEYRPRNLKIMFLHYLIIIYNIME